MTYDRLKYLLKIANELGITTLGELAAYKAKNKIEDNNALMICLQHDRLFG